MADGALPDDTGGRWRAATLSHSQIVDEQRPQVLSRAHSLADRYESWRLGVSETIERLDLAPDLAQGIGSKRWLRGLGTMVGLGALALSFWPSFEPLAAAPPVSLDRTVEDEYRSQMIMPIALGSDSGRRMGASLVVTPLKAAPERPRLDLVATLAKGDSFGRMLRRAGVSGGDAMRVEELVARAVALGEIAPGTQVDVTLGRRAALGEPRPLENLSFRARFDLALAVARGPSGLALEQKPIAVDDTPLRIRGQVGSSLYRAARAAGAPASAVQQYLKALGDHGDLDQALGGYDTFDIVVAHRRAATGERQAGELLYAGVERDGKPRVQLMRWGGDGKFYEASGVGEQRSGLLRPVPGAVSSNYGMRRHPILGYRRMHGGMDFKARHGTPIVAVTDGRIMSAGRAGGCGITVKIAHGGGLATRYCHMSRLAVSSGQGVRRGQVIGYVGSTGLSTGPHLHYEMYRGSRKVNPASVQYVTRAQLSGGELQRFRAQLAALKTVEPGAALADIAPQKAEVEAPVREIDRLAPAR